MKKRMIAIAVLACMLLALLVGCGSGNITAEKAEKIALKDLGVSARKADSVDVHTGTFDGMPCYSVYITVDGHHWIYMIDFTNGEILSATESDTGHSHSH